MTAALAGAMASAAHASLTVDLRIVAVSVGGGTISASKKTLIHPLSGSTVTINVWAQVRGSDLTKSQTVQSVTGSFLSSSGDILVNSQMAGATVTTPFQGESFSAGLVQDLDGDADLDIGSNNMADPDNFFRARSPSLLGPRSNQANGDTLSGFTSAAITGGTEYKIAQLKFIVGTSGLATFLNFRPDSMFDGAVWAEDAEELTSEGDHGTGYTYSGGKMFSPSSGLFTSGAPVLLFNDPEPSSLGLLGVSGLGLLARRHDQMVLAKGT